jgi:CheY-like chemotaxis protein
MNPEPSYSILLVEDDDVAAEAVVRGLRKHGLESAVVIAEDGIVALQILRGLHERRIRKPYIALVDLNMPRMSGLEFLEALRADTELRGTVVFILTTSGTDSDRTQAYRLGVAGYIVKSRVGPQFKKLAGFLAEYQAAVTPP